MINRRLEIGDRLRCGQVFLQNLDGYSSSCAVECQLCDNKTICSLEEFSEHIEKYHTDWENESPHDGVRDVAEVEKLPNPSDEVTQPFEKVLIITESKATLGLLYAGEETTPDECLKSRSEKSETPKSAIALDRSKTLTKSNSKAKSQRKYIRRPYEEFDDDSGDDEYSYDSNESAGDQNKYEELSAEGEVKKNDQNTPTERSEDSGVEKSEVSSFTASTPQHSYSEDETPFEPSALNIREQIRWALNEPPPKAKLTSEHMEKLIELFEAQPRLWQQSHPEYNRPVLCRKSWKEITRKWNKIYHKNFSYRDVRIRIATLCQRYLKERRRQEMATEINEVPKGLIQTARFKHYDRLRFLDSCQNAPYKLYSSNLTHEHEKLLEVYRHFPILWNNQDKHQAFVELREKAYHDICTALQLQGIHIPPKMIRQRLACLRRRYRLEKMRHLHSKLQGKTFDCSFKQYENMKFLDNYIAPFVCDKCGKVSRTLADFEKHIEQMHQEKKVDEVPTIKVVEPKSSSESPKVEEEPNCPPVEDGSRHEVVGLPENQSQISNEINPNQNLDQNVMLHPVDPIVPIQFEIPAMNALTQNPNTTLMDPSFTNNCTIFENVFPDSSSTGLQDPLSAFSSFVDVPIALKSLDNSGDLANFLSNDQYLTLSSAFDTVGGDLVNHSAVQELHNHGNSIPSFNTVFQSPLSNLQMQVDDGMSLQILGNGVELPSNSSTYVPIELILNNGIVAAEQTQNPSNMDIISQYQSINKDQLMEISTIAGDLEKSAIDNNFYHPDHQQTPMEMGFQNTCSLFDNHTRDSFYSQKDLETGPLLEADEPTPTFSENKITQSSNPDSPATYEASNAPSNAVMEETEKVDSTTKDVPADSTENSSEAAEKNMDEEATDEDKKLTAKIECGSLEFELDIEMEKPSSTNDDDVQLNGRLPREYALALITSYRNFPELWHPEHSNYTCRRIRRLAWRSLAKECNAELKTNFSWKKIQRKLLDYIKYFRSERKRIQDKRGCTQWNLYDHFDFLDRVMTPPTDLEQRTQQKALTLNIIDIYKQYPQLWDTAHPDYTTRHLRSRTISEMCLRLQEVHNVTIDEGKLKQRIQELRKELRTTKVAKLLAERRKETFEPLSHFEFYEDLKFLEEHIPPFNCADCNMEFKCFTNYKVHLRQEHKSSNRMRLPKSILESKNTKENICHVCGTKFTMRSNLLQHLSRHYFGRTLACSTCDKKFFTNYSLKEHQRTHTKEPGVICDDCGLTFANLAKLNQHMKRHRNQRDYSCDQCGKLFYTGFDRDRHWRQHFKIRDKICPVCGRDFVEGSSYYAHLKLHKAEKDYVCPCCGKEFAQYAGIYKHFKRYHPQSDKKIRKRQALPNVE